MSCCGDSAFEQDTRTPCICVPSVRVTVLREPDVRKDAACRPVPGFRRRAEHSACSQTTHRGNSRKARRIINATNLVAIVVVVCPVP